MKRTPYMLIVGLLILGNLAPMAAVAATEGETRDVIIQFDGTPDELIKYIRSVGGEVRFRYRNVTAIAATIPTSAAAGLGTVKGVTTVEKDRMMYLMHPLDEGKNNDNQRSFVVEDSTGLVIGPGDPTSVDSIEVPDGYVNFLLTGAAKIWADTYAGEGSIVAVVDSGTAPNACLAHAVIGAPGFPDGYNATSDGVPATSPTNFWHGTHVAGVIASNCTLDLSDAVGEPIYNIYMGQEPYIGWPDDFIPIFGQAPLSSIYPVKVFPESGAGSPTSVILDGLDHILTLKKDGVMDIDVVNMSLGGPTLWDGRDAYDRFIEELQCAGMLVVTSSGNSGPIPNSVGSPATSFGALRVAALDYSESSRSFYEYLGLAVFGVPGQGLVMRPDDEIRVSNFSSRGPTSDGRMGSEIAALGSWNFHMGPENELRWASGTSFASPTVAGAAALLNAWWEDQGWETDPWTMEDVLRFAANPDVVGDPWKHVNAQGFGVLDVSAAFDWLLSGECIWREHPYPGRLHSNVLGFAHRKQTQVWESDLITLDPSEPFDAVFDIGKFTSNVTVEVFDIDIPDNSAYAYYPNALEVHVQSAKRTTYEHPIEVYWYPFYGTEFDIVIDDGPWTFFGIPWAFQPMEPGLMKLSLIGDYSNEVPISFRVRITRENNLKPWKRHRIAKARINQDDSFVIPVEIPENIGKATFDLAWNRDWSRYPTNDLDMYVYDPDGFLVSVDAATANAPEREVVENPMAGTWYVQVEGYEVNKRDRYMLYLTLEEIAP